MMIIIVAAAAKGTCGDFAVAGNQPKPKIRPMKANPKFGDLTAVNVQALSGANTFGGSSGISKDGTTVACYVDNGPNTPIHACRYTDADGLVDLGTLDPANSTLSSFAFGVNADGSVIVGAAAVPTAQSQRHAFRWTQVGGMVDLGSGEGADGFSRAFGTSADGSV